MGMKAVLFLPEYAINAELVHVILAVVHLVLFGAGLTET